MKKLATDPRNVEKCKKVALTDSLSRNTQVNIYATIQSLIDTLLSESPVIQVFV